MFCMILTQIVVVNFSRSTFIMLVLTEYTKLKRDHSIEQHN